MSFNNSDPVSLHSSSQEIAIHYHVRRALLGMKDREKEPHREIIDACLAGPLSNALYAIREWSMIWAEEVAPGFDRMEGPEIALNLNVTSRGNLEVTWEPMMTQEQYNSGPDNFKYWMRQLGHQAIAQRRDNQLYFIRDFQSLHWLLADNRLGGDVLEMSRISAVALAVMMAELPEKLSGMVQAHWQDVLEFNFPARSLGGTPVSAGISLHDIWEHSQEDAERRLCDRLADIGVDADRLTAEWDQVEVTNPRIKTDTGRSKAVAKILGVQPDQVSAARSAMEAAARWSGKKPHLWWNRTAPYPHWWGGYRR